jgi:hypothetical protein
MTLTPPEGRAGHRRSKAILRLGSYQLVRLRGLPNETFEMASSRLSSAQAGDKLTNSIAANESDQQQYPCRDCNNFHGGVFYSCAYSIIRAIIDRPAARHRTTAGCSSIPAT